MRSSRSVHVVGCHAEGEVGDVIDGGMAHPLRATLCEWAGSSPRTQGLRQFAPNEPRGGVTGTHQHFLDPDDPWPQGYPLADTWPAPEPARLD